MKTITVSLPDDYAAEVEARVAAGEYDSLDEAVTVAVAERLSLLEQASPSGENESELRAEIRAAIEQVERGEFLDGEEFMADLRRRTAARLAASAVPA